ncbi:unnamed protein product [Gongylonema pulchrum]|uniref:Uncharacterized protein n=1 Tax=Gongylonema pulchrum TaxID=637853 RepID=A0A183CWT3_9BILA|nr:unnamed protein product [Gongylonema pulchrum]
MMNVYGVIGNSPVRIASDRVNSFKCRCANRDDVHGTDDVGMFIQHSTDQPRLSTSGKITSCQEQQKWCILECSNKLMH